MQMTGKGNRVEIIVAKVIKSSYIFLSQINLNAAFFNSTSR